MTPNINYKYSVFREDAMEYLLKNVEQFPKEIPGKIAISIFQGWRWVESLEGEIIFADCISPFITAKDLQKRREGVAEMWNSQ